MFTILRNKKGIFPLLTGSIFAGQAVFTGSVLLLIGLSVAVRPQHIVNRAVEKCVINGDSHDACVQAVKNMPQEDRIEYLKDTETNPSPYDPNYGANTTGLKI